MEFVEITPILKNNYPFLPFIIWFFVSLLAWGVSGFYASTKETTKEYRYTAIVDDSADYKEIVEKYNIIESHGKIWVLEDKDD